ncbi:MAG TPA: ATP-binding protein, partial [Chitinophagaceae bacterium]
GIIQNWNLGAEKIKGYKTDEIIGKNFRVFYTEEDRQNHRPEKLLKQAVDTGRATDEGWRVRKDGTRFWGSIVITALHDENNNIIGFSKVTRDRTEQKMAEEKLKKYAEELEQKNEELIKTNKDLESFNYVASHDLQEPLHKIQIFSDSILSNESKNLSERGSEYFNRIFNAANRMQQLIEDLLAFSRATPSNAEFEDSDLNTLLNEVLAAMHFSIEESHAVIESESLPVAHIIPFQFRQVLQNLISNSIKYSKAGSPPYIKISAKKFTTKNNRGGLRPNYTYLVLTIEDEGIGFDQECAEKIFELFQRLHTKDEYPGTGIGLAIVKKIIQNHHGIIRAKSSPGNGATFEIYIPQEAV